ncbi:polysaccharide pyruvyl transferase family protein [Mycobacterium sp. ITM-2016-00317]|uniref:polysaccharide pyruvyl transferase family protein n=1 Tax=Mycobacterium sp. ITM-2016-00317 TaxID=2099694 RepID=UPI00287F47FE|nr:polysaccharide pyruvyl transferase family protein [Mycobacterium sp. ITM-2016-00317]WNG88958.1 polysaccharide pyruvyl transferase family protein [Mycobacterium sp. ITM-2016-00317]
MKITEDSRKILIIGTDFRNQGAYLMMIAAIQEITRRFRGTPVLSAKVGNMLQRRRVGALTMLPMSARVPHTEFSKGLWAKGDIVDYRDIDIVLDASGFFYSDSWKQFVDGRSKILQTFGELGTPIFFLPQAFGPFESTAETSAAALSTGKIVFARDPTSLTHVNALVERFDISASVESAPDFTCLVKGHDSDWHQLSGAVPVIPNYNIVARARTAEDAKNYIRNLVEFALAARAAGRQVYGLSHEGRKDTRILKEVAQQVGNFQVVDGYNGVQLKSLLGSSPYAVVGRFHAAVSCLTQATPLIAHGWSHKYQHLMEDFHHEKRLLDPFLRLSRDEVAAHIEELEGFAGAEVDDLKRCVDSYRSGSVNMWNQIEQAVSS